MHRAPPGTYKLPPVVVVGRTAAFRGPPVVGDGAGRRERRRGPRYPPDTAHRAPESRAGAARAGPFACRRRCCVAPPNKIEQRRPLPAARGRREPVPCWPIHPCACRKRCRPGPCTRPACRCGRASAAAAALATRVISMALGAYVALLSTQLTTKPGGGDPFTSSHAHVGQYRATLVTLGRGENVVGPIHRPCTVSRTPRPPRCSSPTGAISVVVLVVFGHVPPVRVCHQNINLEGDGGDRGYYILRRRRGNEQSAYLAEYGVWWWRQKQCCCGARGAPHGAGRCCA